MAFLFICLCLHLFLFSPVLASPFFTFSFFACLLSVSFLLPSCFSCQFLFFLFAFTFKMFFCFCFSACCMFGLASLYIYCFFLGFASCFLVVVWFFCLNILLLSDFGTYHKTSLKNMEIPKTPKMKNAEKRTF